MAEPVDRTGDNGGTGTNGGGPGGPGASPLASGVDTIIKIGTFFLALLALIALALFIRFLLANVAATELAWQRYVYLLTGIEAIAFAAAGYLFGREVNRGAVQQAEKRAETAEDTAGKVAQRADDTERCRKALEDEAKHARSLAAAQGARLNDLKATVNGMDSSYPTRVDGLVGVTIAPEDGDDSWPPP